MSASEPAVEAAKRAVVKRTLEMMVLNALDAAHHDASLGLDRSVCLRDVVEALREMPIDHADRDPSWADRAADFIEREFGTQ